MANANMTIVANHAQARRLADILKAATNGGETAEDKALSTLAQAIYASVPDQDSNEYYLVAWSGLVSEPLPANDGDHKAGSTASIGDRVDILEKAVGLLARASQPYVALNLETSDEILALQKAGSPLITLMPNLVNLAQGGEGFAHQNEHADQSGTDAN